jgi:hypothetical protein
MSFGAAAHHRAARATHDGMSSLDNRLIFWPLVNSESRIPDFAEAIAWRFDTRNPSSSGGRDRPMRLKNGRL